LILRTFIAVDFQTEILTKIKEIVDYLRTQAPVDALKWVGRDNLHLTLKFIGEISQDKINRVKALMVDALNTSTAFTLEVKGLGMYPNAKKPRVIWLGIENVSGLVDLHKHLDRALSQVDIKPDTRPFSPHLTIARVRKNAAPNQVSLIGETLSQFKVGSLGITQIENVRLYQSELTPQGSIYTPLMTISLNQV
jgi:2'-5' RNA ligase